MSDEGKRQKEALLRRWSRVGQQGGLQLTSVGTAPGGEEVGQEYVLMARHGGWTIQVSQPCVDLLCLDNQGSINDVLNYMKNPRCD